jgi:dTDP-4-dehydrorhamnose reductase
MRVLITGTSGQIGWELARAFPAGWSVIPITRAEIDLAHPETIAPAIRRHLPDVIVNAAAYTAVDRAEIEPELAHRVNAESVGVLAHEAKSCGAAIVHFSTDYVFDGTGRTPYTPDDQPNPQSVYGHSKLAGERALLESGASHLILRAAWVYALRGRNFLLAILRQAALKPELRVVNDQVGAPTWARCVAQASSEIITRHLAGGERNRNFAGREGIYHLTCGGATTWFDFARAIFDEAQIPAPKLQPITTLDYAARAHRPAYSVLDCTRTKSVFGVVLPDWRDALRRAASDRAALADAIAHAQRREPESRTHEHAQSAAKTRK